VKAKTALVIDVVTIQRANLVTMTKLMLLVKQTLLRPQFSFDDFLADEAVDDIGLVEILMALLVNHGVIELENHGTRPRNLVKAKSAPVVNDDIVNHLTMKLVPLKSQLNFDANWADVAVDDVEVTEMLKQLANHVATKLASHVTRTPPVNLVTTTPPANRADVARKLKNPKNLKKRSDAHLNAEMDEDGEAAEGNLTLRLSMDTLTSLALKVKLFLESTTKQAKALL